MTRSCAFWFLFLCFVLSIPLATAVAQEAHNHTPAVSGVPQGVPYFCENPTITSIAAGRWSEAKTWSTGRPPGANDKVKIGAGHTVTVDTVNDAKLNCIQVNGTLRFAPDSNTRLKTANLTVMEDGSLEIGTADHPIAASVKAEIIIADQPIDKSIDPAQIGTGIEGLGKVTMHGSVKTPTFVRLTKEPATGDTALVFDQPVNGWMVGDHLVLPDTRQLRSNERGANYEPQDEEVQIASISSNQVTLAAPLRHDHKGARDGLGKLDFLPHVGNVTRNVVIRSENPEGTRGHMIFIYHANVDLRYVEVRDMGRTKMGVLDNSEFDNSGRLTKFGTNQIGRYAIHFHHDFGPKVAPASGYQFTLIGNAVNGAPKWGVTVHNSHYGLVN
jgi:hypothetical protein